MILNLMRSLHEIENVEKFKGIANLDEERANIGRYVTENGPTAAAKHKYMPSEYV